MTLVKNISAGNSADYNIRLRRDRIGKYFSEHLKGFLFAELSEAYMEKGEILDFMKGIPVPLKNADLKIFAGGSGVDPKELAENMAWIIGTDPHFKYTEQYVLFLDRVLKGRAMGFLLEKGITALAERAYNEACIYFRACLCLETENLDAMFHYACCCREMYLASENREYTGDFKAEALDYFELVTEAHPKHAKSHYYLGYMYLNLGLYTKARLVWNKFLGLSEEPADIDEIKQRIRQLEDPVRIEQAINNIISGRDEQGIPVLESYLESDYKDWWPLHYYLGLAYASVGRQEDAIGSFKRVLEKNGSHLDSMAELAELFKASGDVKEEQKYRRKMQIVEQNILH